jgi:DNA-binding response OmpR family regulator
MGECVHVLLVDDNPAIRLTLLEAISPMATVQAACSGFQALSRAARQRPDLVILGYRLPDMSGIELLSKLYMSLPRIAAVMVAKRADLAGPLASWQGELDEFIEKPFFVEEAFPRIQRVLDRVALNKATSEAADSGSVRGSLAQMSVLDLIQALDAGRKTCRLVLTYKRLVSRIYFHDGRLVHATCGNLSGEAVIHEVVAWTAGAFLIDFEWGDCPRTITQGTQVIVLEALHRLDESKRASELSKRAS